MQPQFGLDAILIVLLHLLGGVLLVRYFPSKSDVVEAYWFFQLWQTEMEMTFSKFYLFVRWLFRFRGCQGLNLKFQAIKNR